jgi:UDP-N-acetyl-D-glucosamine dehydrogenase
MNAVVSVSASSRGVLSQRIAAGDFSVGIIGLGAVGAVTAELIAGAGVRVAGYDRSEVRLAEIRERLAKAGCELDHRPEHLADADIIVIAVRAPITASGEVNLAALHSALDAVRTLPTKERLIILETTMPPGTTRRLATEALSEGERERLLVAHCPERLRVGDTPEDLRQTPRLVGGMTEAATEAACQFLARVGVRAVAVSQPEVAELSKLLENTFLTTGIALMAEVTRIAHALGIEAHEVATAAQTKPRGYYPFFPGAGVGGHCLPNDLRLLGATAQSLGLAGNFLNGVEWSTAQMAETTVRRLETLVRERGSTLQHSLVWLIGLGFKAGSPDTTCTPATEVIRILRNRGARLIYSDSLVPEFTVDSVPVTRFVPGLPPAGIAAALILSGDRAIDLAVLGSVAPVVLDAGGAQVMKGHAANMAHL